jgi:hypothetical protein
LGWLPSKQRLLGEPAYSLRITAKEKLLRDVLDLDEAKAARARIVVADEPEDGSEMAPLPRAGERR